VRVAFVPRSAEIKPLFWRFVQNISFPSFFFFGRVAFLGARSHVLGGGRLRTWAGGGRLRPRLAGSAVLWRLCFVLLPQAGFRGSLSPFTSDGDGDGEGSPQAARQSVCRAGALGSSGRLSLVSPPSLFEGLVQTTWLLVRQRTLSRASHNTCSSATSLKRD